MEADLKSIVEALYHYSGQKQPKCKMLLMQLPSMQQPGAATKKLWVTAEWINLMYQSNKEVTEKGVWSQCWFFAAGLSFILCACVLVGEVYI